MKIKPLGFYILIEMEVVENISEGGIVLPEDLISKEQDATSVGYVRAIGPTAFAGYPGCDCPEYFHNQIRDLWQPHEAWGLKVGQKIEYRKFEGKKSSVKDHENYRYIPDSHIIGVIDDE